MLKIGNTDINKGYIGNQEVNKAYLGSNIVLETSVFTSTWQTTSPNETITLPTTSNYIVNWGDGTVTNNTNSHEYLSVGQYTIKINGGDVIDFAFNNLGDKDKIYNVSVFGKLQLIPSTFRGCSNLDITATDVPLINNDSIFEVFRNCINLVYNSSINSLDVSNIKNASFLFIDSVLFNQDISGWNTSSFEDISFMFTRCIFNKSINNWDFSSVLDCESIFLNNTSYNQEINWNTSNCEIFSAFLYGATGYNKPVTLDTSSALSLSRFLFINTTFNENLIFSDTSNVENFSECFRRAREFNKPLDWDTSSAINMSGMFREARDFNQSLNGFDFSNVTNMSNFMLTKTNYDINYMDDLYIKLDQELIFSNMVNINISFGTIPYSINGAAARTSLINKGFIIQSGIQI